MKLRKSWGETGKKKDKKKSMTGGIEQKPNPEEE